ncbi:uncharacterized protein BDV17DRAFT_239671 [Aspergillus undulatus]|uniref:uncharacterized protein n=1 Tax=Aspergillus undulatus TaxID=1810928 RepID=UPI003CCCDE8F
MSLMRKQQLRTLQRYILRRNEPIGPQKAGGVLSSLLIFLCGVPAAEIEQVVIVSFLLLNLDQGIFDSRIVGSERKGFSEISDSSLNYITERVSHSAAHGQC